MTAVDLVELLTRLKPDLDSVSEPWAIIGSAALILAGAPWADCQDIDILTTGAGAGQLEQLWAVHRDGGGAPDRETLFRSRFSCYDFRPGFVEVMGDLEVRLFDGWTSFDVRQVRCMSLTPDNWPVPTLTEQLRILEMFGRPKDLAKATVVRSCLHV